MNTPDIPEVEGKILDVDFEKLSRYLETHGAKLVFDGRINAQWLININGQKVRVREEGDVVKVEHKKKLEGEVGVKTFKETGFSADDFDAVINTFLELGLTLDGLPSVKQRVSYILHGRTKEDTIRFDFDTYSSLNGKSIPTLLEIEAATKGKVYYYASILGFSEDQVLDYGPMELLQHYYPNLDRE